MNRDNQQETPKEGEIAWLAGVIETDGTVMLSAHMRKDYPQSMPKVGVEIKLYNTDGGIIAKAIDVLERLDVGAYISERNQSAMKMESGKSYGDVTKPMISIGVKRFSHAYKLAKLIEPWMFGEKGHRLRLVIQFLARRLEKTGFENTGSSKNTQYDEGDVRLIQRFYSDFVRKPSTNRDLVLGLLRD